MSSSPWQRLTERSHITLRIEPLEDEYGYIEDHGDGTRTIVLADDLDAIGRRCVLDHELAHDETGLLYEADSEPRLVEKFEVWTEKRSTKRMVPQADLIEFVERNQEFMPITIDVVADHFRVTHELARQAIEAMPAF